MAVLKIKRNTSLDEIEYPEIVYKYRCWDNPVHQSILINRQIFMAAPSSFEDKLDCKFPIRWDLLKNKEIYNYFLNYSRGHNQGPEKGHHAFARKMFQQTGVRDANIIAEHQNEVFEEYDQRVGVLSLTENPTIEEMWNTYACNHEGFAVGFNSRIMFDFLGGGGGVTYVDKIPIIYPTPKHSYIEQRNLQIFHKLSKWSYEEEYRTTIFRPNPLSVEDRIIELPPEAYQEIILGKNMSDKNIAEIKNILPKVKLENTKLKTILLADHKMIINDLQ